MLELRNVSFGVEDQKGAHKEILKNINLIEQIKNRDIYQYLKKYNVYKNKYFT